VLLVDDHRLILNQVSALLTDEFTVVGMVTDGRKALEAAQQTNPDVIVLDVSMPGFNGFQTCSMLQLNDTRAPVVFLSMNDDTEFIQEAFRRGGRGYVLKSQMQRDLERALDHVLLGRLFTPSLPSLFHQATGNAHGMHVCGDSESINSGLATFFDEALRRGDAACVIATEAVRDGLARRLDALGWAMDSSFGHPRYRSVDADDALNRFMRNGLPDTTALSDIAAELDEYRRLATNGAGSRLTIFGTMAGILCERGNVEGAMALETAWSTVTEHLPFFTVCGYAAGCFHEGVPDLWSRASAAHWAVSHSGNL
jgi:DNA-binding NarL/FixJ family response regulator